MLDELEISNEQLLAGNAEGTLTWEDMKMGSMDAFSPLSCTLGDGDITVPCKGLTENDVGQPEDDWLGTQENRVNKI